MIENACKGKQNSDKNDKPVDTVNNQELDAYNFIDKYVNNKKNTGTQDNTKKTAILGDCDIADCKLNHPAVCKFFF